MKKAFVPHYTAVRVIMDEDEIIESNRRRSTWLGATQAVLNLPRMMALGLFRSVASAFGCLAAAGTILVHEVFVHPFKTFWTSFHLGRMGFLVDEGSEELGDREVGYMQMFDRGAFQDVSITLRHFGFDPDEDETEIEADQ